MASLKLTAVGLDSKSSESFNLSSEKGGFEIRLFQYKEIPKAPVIAIAGAPLTTISRIAKIQSSKVFAVMYEVVPGRTL